MKLSHYEPKMTLKSHVLYNCKYCAKQYQSKRALKRHITSKHKLPELVPGCSHCEKQFTRQELATRHTRLHHLGVATVQYKPPIAPAIQPVLPYNPPFESVPKKIKAKIRAAQYTPTPIKHQETLPPQVQIKESNKRRTEEIAPPRRTSTITNHHKISTYEERTKTPDKKEDQNDMPSPIRTPSPIYMEPTQEETIPSHVSNTLRTKPATDRHNSELTTNEITRSIPSYDHRQSANPPTMRKIYPSSGGRHPVYRYVRQPPTLIKLSSRRLLKRLKEEFELTVSQAFRLLAEEDIVLDL